MKESNLDLLNKFIAGGLGSGRHIEEGCVDSSMHRHPKYGEDEQSGFCHPFNQIHNHPRTLRLHINELKTRVREQPGNTKAKVALEESEAFARGESKEIEASYDNLRKLNALKKGGAGSGRRSQEQCPSSEDHKHFGMGFCHPIIRGHRGEETNSAHTTELKLRAQTNPELKEKIKGLIGEEHFREEMTPEEAEESRTKERGTREEAQDTASKVIEERLIEQETRKIMTRERIPYNEARPIAEEYHPKPEERGPEWSPEEEEQAKIEERYPGFHPSRPAPWHTQIGVTVLDGTLTSEKGFELARTIYSNKESGGDFQAEIHIVNSPDGKFYLGPLDEELWGAFDREEDASKFIRDIFEKEQIPKDGEEAAQLAKKWINVELREPSEEERERVDGHIEEQEQREQKIRERTPEEREEARTQAEGAQETAETLRERETEREQERRAEAARGEVSVEGRRREQQEAEARERRERPEEVADKERIQEIARRDKNQRELREIAERDERRKAKDKAPEPGRTLTEDDFSTPEEYGDYLRRRAETTGWIKQSYDKPRRHLVTRTEQFPMVFGKDEYFIHNIAHLLKHVMGDEVLHLSSGEGDLLDILNASGYSVLGIDGNRDNVLSSLSKGQDALVYKIKKELPFANRTFDSVISMDLLKGIEDAVTLANESFRIARKSAAHLFSIEEGSLESVKTIFKDWNVSEVPETGCVVISKQKGEEKKRRLTPLERDQRIQYRPSETPAMSE